MSAETAPNLNICYASRDHKHGWSARSEKWLVTGATLEMQHESVVRILGWTEKWRIKECIWCHSRCLSNDPIDKVTPK